MSKWHVTVGYPGGEFAVKSENAVLAKGALCNAMLSGLGFSYQEAYIRPAPPELAEWLDASEGWHGAVDGSHGRMKVPGGWLYDNGKGGTTYVPVALAAGITVLEAEHDGR